jgi:polyferredoxin
LAAFIQALFDGQGFSSFLAEPAIVIIGLTALISMPIWGRALFCGWLCPFGALQELLNKFAIFIGIKQKRISEKNDRVMKLGKYVLLSLLTITFLYSFDLGLKASAIEPFKSAITFRFNAPPLALVWVLFLLFIGVFIERAYCRFLCPLGAAASLIGKVRIFNFLHRRKECGNPCKACSPACPTQAIRFNGKIDMNECFQCLDCQVMYFDKHKCPPLVAKYKRI